MEPLPRQTEGCVDGNCLFVDLRPALPSVCKQHVISDPVETRSVPSGAAASLRQGLKSSGKNVHPALIPSGVNQSMQLWWERNCYHSRGTSPAPRGERALEKDVLDLIIAVYGCPACAFLHIKYESLSF